MSICMSKSATFSHPFSALLKAQIDPRIQGSYLIKAHLQDSLVTMKTIHTKAFKQIDLFIIAAKCIKKCGSCQKHAKTGVRNEGGYDTDGDRIHP